MRPHPSFALYARQLLIDGDIKGAVELCKFGLIYFPESVTGYAVLAEAYLTLDEKDRALNVLQDGYFRTGIPQLEYLRAQLAGEEPAIAPAGTENIDDTPQGEADVNTKINITPEESAEEDPEPRTIAPVQSVSDLANEPSSTSSDQEHKQKHSATITWLGPPPLPATEDEEVPAVPTPDHKKGQATALEGLQHPKTDTEQSSRKLELHTGKNIARLSSANLRLIPGLEFAPLRHRVEKEPQKIAPLLSESLPKAVLPNAKAEQPRPGTQESPAPSKQPPPPDNAQIADLDALARKLETAHIPSVESDKKRAGKKTFKPALLSETFADILAAQGAWNEARDAYFALAETKPERRTLLLRKAEEMASRLESATE